MKNLTSFISVLLIMLFLLGTCTVSANPAAIEIYSLGDVNGDKNVNAQDALLVLRYAVGKIAKFPAEKMTNTPTDITSTCVNI